MVLPAVAGMSRSLTPGPSSWPSAHRRRVDEPTFTVTEIDAVRCSQRTRGGPLSAGTRTGRRLSCRAGLVITSGQVPCPPAGSDVAVSGQDLVAAVTPHRWLTIGAVQVLTLCPVAQTL